MEAYNANTNIIVTLSGPNDGVEITQHGRTVGRGWVSALGTHIVLLDALDTTRSGLLKAIDAINIAGLFTNGSWSTPV